MAGEVLLINPRRRRRKSRVRRARAHSPRRRRRARRNPFPTAYAAMANRRRRRGRRVHARKHSRRRAHRNPRLPFVGAINMGLVRNAVSAGIGFEGTRFGATWLMSVLPAQWSADPNTAPLVRFGVKAVVGFGILPLAAKALRQGKMASWLAVGAGVAIVADIFETYLESKLPLPKGVTSLADYEQRYVSAYDVAQLTDYTEGEGMSGGAFGGSAYGGAAGSAY